MIYICLWPDGTWCEHDDIESYLQWMSDDYQLLELTFDQYEQFVNTH